MQLTCVVDNSVEAGSPLWGEHGLSFIIEADDKKVLFDTGQSGDVLMHNLELLKYEPKEFAAVALSHGHYDHTGGLSAFLKSAYGISLVAHSAIFDERFTMRKKKPPRSVGIPISPKKLSKLADVNLTKKSVELMPGLWTTGTIYSRQHPEGRSAKHVVQRNGQFVPDPYLDDLSLVWKGDEGLVVVLGCAHAGVLNILSQVRDMFAAPIRAVVGGMHLYTLDDERLAQVIETLRNEYADTRFYPNHCTGMKGFLALERAFGEKVMPCPAGTTLEF